jgi:hypothetical protein
MMSLRRWLTSRYDVTGISRLFYRSWRIELGAILAVALLTGLGFLLFGFAQGDIHSYHGPSAFLPSHKIHLFDWAMAVVLTILLAGNCARMWWLAIGSDAAVTVPLTAYLRKAYLLPVHFLTQMRYAKCGHRSPWLVHLVLVMSYLTMLVLIMFFLEYMAAGPAIDWRVHAFGLAATVGLLATTLYAVRGRLGKTATHYKHTHETDWLFLILLVIAAGTGAAQFILHRSGLEVAANIAYVVHLTAVVPMLTLEVPFGKWSHLAYRPLAMYFAEIKGDAIVAERPSRQPLPAPHAA